MVFTFPYPQTIEQAFVMLVPFLTLVLGLLYLVFPRVILNFSGVKAVEGKAHAIGEGRSSYAGILIAFGAGCLFLQEPIALQPGLNLLLAIAWLVTSIGFGAQIIFDAGRNLTVILKMLFALTMAAIAYWSAEPVTFNFTMPNGLIVEWAIFLVAGLTLILGLISLLLPNIALKILKFEPITAKLYGKGETRGLLAGFYIALGFACIFYTDPFIAKQFAAVILAGAWFFTGIGRIISILVDRGATLYNFVGVIFEIGLGVLLLGLILGLI